MERIIAIVGLIFFLWFAIPHLSRGEWIAPTAAPADHWAYAIAAPGSQELLATPPEGYGWFRFDIWNNPTTDGRPL